MYKYIFSSECRRLKLGPRSTIIFIQPQMDSNTVMDRPGELLTEIKDNQINHSYFWAHDNRQGWNYTEYFSFFNDFNREDENGKYSEVTIVSLLVVISLFINVILTCFFLMKKALRNHQHTYTLCLMLSSIVFLPAAQMVGISRLSSDGWMFGMFGCQTILYVIITTAFIKIWLMTLVSFDRYLKVNRHQRWHLGPKLVGVLSIAAWCIPMVIVGALLYPNTETKEIEMGYGKITICTVAFQWHPIIPQALAHFGGLLLFMYLLPITIMIICYARIMAKLSKSAANMKRHTSVKFNPGGKSIAARSRSNLRKRRVTLILMAIMVLFFFMWTPLFIMLGWITIDMQTDTYYLSSRWIVGQLCLLIINTTIEPFLYSFTSNKVRSELRKTIRQVLNVNATSSTTTLDDTSTQQSA